MTIGGRTTNGVRFKSSHAQCSYVLKVLGSKFLRIKVSTLQSSYLDESKFLQLQGSYDSKFLRSNFMWVQSSYIAKFLLAPRSNSGKFLQLDVPSVQSAYVKNSQSFKVPKSSKSYGCESKSILPPNFCLINHIA
jgi:hypothetical protein